MKKSSKQNLPNNACSPQEDATVRKAITKDKLDTLGIYTKSLLLMAASTLGAAFTIMLELQISGKIGEIWFEPIPGQESSSLFGKNTVLAATLLTVISLHLASLSNPNSSIIKLLDKWAPRCAMLFLIGLALMILTTMSADLSTGGDEWSTNIPALAEFIGWLNTAIFEPLGQLGFAVGFSCVVLLSAFALSKFLEWWLEAVQNMLTKATESKVKQRAAEATKRIKRAYRPKAASINEKLSRSQSDEQLAFALLVIKTKTTLITENRKHIPKDNQFGSYMAPESQASNDELDAFDRECSFDYVLSAIKGKAAVSSTQSEH